MSTSIADLPLDDRPRERLLMHGPALLSDSELLAILIGSGTHGRNAIDVARETMSGDLTSVSRRAPAQLAELSGIGPAKASRILAAFEIGRRVSARTIQEPRPLPDIDSLARTLLPRYSHFVQERLGAICLDARNRVISEREIFVGTINSAQVSTREVVRYALDEHAIGLVVFHNHPSGDPSPSAEDLFFTRKLCDALALFDMRLIDHIILGASDYVLIQKRNGG
jgi:DNA repair protein RadC